MDEELWRTCLGGDDYAFTQLYKRYVGWWSHSAQSITWINGHGINFLMSAPLSLQTDDAIEVAHRTLRELYFKRKRITNFRSYLFTRLKWRATDLLGGKHPAFRRKDNWERSNYFDQGPNWVPYRKAMVDEGLSEQEIEAGNRIGELANRRYRSRKQQAIETRLIAALPFALSQIGSDLEAAVRAKFLMGMTANEACNYLNIRKKVFQSRLRDALPKLRMLILEIDEKNYEVPIRFQQLAMRAA